MKKREEKPKAGRPPTVAGGLGPMRGFRAPDALIERLDRIKRREGVDRSELVRRVLETFCDEWERGAEMPPTPKGMERVHADVMPGLAETLTRWAEGRGIDRNTLIRRELERAVRRCPPKYHTE
jgi:hypothetical protein